MENTKTNQAVKLLESGAIKKALSILKTFKMGLTKDEIRIIQIANEMQSAERQKFYEQIGIDVQETFKYTVEIINRIWLADSDKKLVIQESEIITIDFEAFENSKAFLKKKKVSVPNNYQDCIQLAYSLETESKGDQNSNFMNFVNNK